MLRIFSLKAICPYPLRYNSTLSFQSSKFSMHKRSHHDDLESAVQPCQKLLKTTIEDMPTLNMECSWYTSPDTHDTSPWASRVTAREAAMTTMSWDEQLFRMMASAPAPNQFHSSSGSPAFSSSFGDSPNLSDAGLEIAADHELEFELNSEMGMVWTASSPSAMGASLFPSSEASPLDPSNQDFNSTMPCVYSEQLFSDLEPACGTASGHLNHLEALESRLQANTRDQLEKARSHV